MGREEAPEDGAGVWRDGRPAEQQHVCHLEWQGRQDTGDQEETVSCIVQVALIIIF